MLICDSSMLGNRVGCKGDSVTRVCLLVGWLSPGLSRGGAVLVGLGCMVAMAQPPDDMVQAPFELRSAEANGRAVFLNAAGFLELPAHARDLRITFAPSAKASNAPVRFRWQLEGFHKGWQDTDTISMRVGLRFSDDTTDVLSETTFQVSGQTAGWTGRFRDSAYVLRGATIVVPQGANRVRMVISSAGPREAVGAYVMRNLFFSMPGVTTNRTRMIPPLARSALELPAEQIPPPPGWNRGGLHVTDAHVVPYGDAGDVGLALVDDQIDGHADWTMLRSQGWPVLPGESLVVEWEEAYSISQGDFMVAGISEVPAGLYRFRMGGFTVMGEPTGVESFIPVSVPMAFWATRWFWAMMLLAGVGVGLAGWRLREWRRMARKFKLMERDRAVEQERIRIAQDIHDDLGARVTEVSLLSSAAKQRQGVSEEIRADLEQVSHLSQAMVRALYDTVWAVSPENDNLDSLGAYICQTSTRMCAQANLRCRLTVPDLPGDIPLASKLRHDVIMTVKEAVHNVIKHANATELQLAVLLEHQSLTITIRDNGSGFDLSQQPLGSGLSNMKRRMEACGGRCSIWSQPGQGTQIRLELSLDRMTAGTEL